MNHIIEVDHLMKSYGTVKAVQDISFYVEEGGLFAFLGPNGAGKSTTINMICTFLRARRRQRRRRRAPVWERMINTFERISASCFKTVCWMIC